MKQLIALVCLLVALPAMAPAAPLQLLSPVSEQLDATTTAAVTQLLDTKWDRGADNKLESKSIFAEVPHDNPEILVAYALNRIKHGSVAQALPIAKDARLRFGQNWDARSIEVWLLTLTDQYDASLVQLRSFKKQLDVAQNKNRLSAITAQNIYRRFGRLIAYLEGPVIDKVDTQLLADTTVLLEQNIAPETKKAFSLARQAGNDKYKELLTKQTNYQNQELTKVAASNEVEKERLLKDNQLAQQTRERLKPELERLTNEGYSITNQLDRQISSAASSLGSINQSAYGLEQQLGFLYADLFSLGRHSLGSSYAIENQIYRVELELSQQRIAAANQAGVINGLQNDLFAARQNYQRQIGQAQRNLKQVEVVQKRNFEKLQKIAAGPKIAGGKTQSLATRRTALTSYYNLSLELYRQEILDAVRAVDAGR